MERTCPVWRETAYDGQILAWLFVGMLVKTPMDPMKQAATWSS